MTISRVCAFAWGGREWESCLHRVY